MLATIACGLAFLITRTVAANDLELWAYDFLVNHGGYSRSADNIVVVDFDNHSVKEIGRFPVPRGVLAKVINRVANAKPPVIGLDFFLTETREPAEDDALQQALTNAGSVIAVGSRRSAQPRAAAQVLPARGETAARVLPGRYTRRGWLRVREHAAGQRRLRTRHDAVAAQSQRPVFISARDSAAVCRKTY
jgi:CHASE2 domain-containing sensor protein